MSERRRNATTTADVAFREIGPVELKGVGRAIRLHAAARAGSAGGLPCRER